MNRLHDAASASGSVKFHKYVLPPLVPLCISLIMGIIAGNIYPNLKLFSFLLIVFLLSLIVFKIIKGESINILKMILFFCIGYYLISFTISPDLSQNHISKYTDKGKLWIQGRVCSFPFVTGRIKKLVLSVEKIEKAEFIGKKEKISVKGTKKLINNTRGKIKLGIYYASTIYNIRSDQRKYGVEYTDKIRYGDVIRFKSSIKSIHNFNNPGGFDYLRYMTFKSIFGSAYAKRKKIKILNKQKKKSLFLSFLRFVEDYRDNFALFIFKNTDNKNSAAVLTALLTGEKQYIGKKLRAEFSEAGASHILAISGLHLSIIAGIFFYFFKWLFSFVTPFLIRGWSRKAAAIMTLIPLIFYAVLSGFSPSTKRALIMILIFMTSFVIEEETDSLNSLAAAGIAILILEPGALFSISFQLSFIAVLSIISGFILISRLSFLKEKNFQTKIFYFIFTSFCAIAGTSPIVMHYFNIISFAGIFTNLLIIPAAGFAVLPLGISALFVHPFSITASAFFVKCCGMILSFCLIFIHYISNFPFAWTRTITPDIIEILSYYILFAGIVLLLNHKKKSGLLCIISVFVIITGNEIIWIHKRFFNKNICITILDVGQGSSALLELPKGKRVLVDGGGFSYFANFDTGKNIVAPFLWRKRIMTLDMVVLTHPESDHMNGLVYIFNNFKVKIFVKNCDTRKTIAYGDLMAAVLKNKSRVYILYNGHKADLMTIENGLTKNYEMPDFKGTLKVFHINDKENINMDGAYLKFFTPFINCFHFKDRHKDFNNNFIVFKLVFKNISILFTGDIMKDAEKKLVLMEDKELKSDILIAPHHGSSTSSSDFFLDKVAPESVVISCGRHNRFHFPHLSVLKRYGKRKIKIFRTDLNGAVTIGSNGNRFRILTQQPLQ